MKAIDAPIVAVPTAAVGRLPDILPGTEIGWMDGSDPVDSPVGTTVLVGHVVFAGIPAVFAGLAGSQPGDDVVLRHGGTDDHYRVDGVASYPKGDLPSELWAPRTLRTLILITCGGPKDPTTGLRLLNVVVTAHLVGSSPASS